MDKDIKVQPRWVIHFFLWLGLLAGTAVRSLTLVSRVNAETAIMIWRFAMVSYTIFFGYRYMIARRRRRVVNNYRLLEHIGNAEELDPKAKEAMQYILRSVVRSKELFNYAFISSLSLIALIIDWLTSR
ncbi:MAG: hypothetical protein JXR40_06810 [Pontiellaceae bacterium]|nr:hypothetical protein [Pontiellaceae bacterium]